MNKKPFEILNTSDVDWYLLCFVQKVNTVYVIETSSILV